MSLKRGKTLLLGYTKIAMSKESGRRIVLLHADSSESEKRNQLALIKGQLLVDSAQDATTGEMKVKLNKILKQVRYLASTARSVHCVFGLRTRFTC